MSDYSNYFMVAGVIAGVFLGFYIGDSSMAFLLRDSPEKNQVFAAATVGLVLAIPFGYLGAKAGYAVAFICYALFVARLQIFVFVAVVVLASLAAYAYFNGIPSPKI